MTRITPDGIWPTTCASALMCTSSIWACKQPQFIESAKGAAIAGRPPIVLCHTTGPTRNIHPHPPSDKMASSLRVGVRAYATRSLLPINSHSSRPKNETPIRSPICYSTHFCFTHDSLACPVCGGPWRSTYSSRVQRAHRAHWRRSPPGHFAQWRLGLHRRSILLRTLQLSSRREEG